MEKEEGGGVSLINDCIGDGEGGRQGVSLINDCIGDGEGGRRRSECKAEKIIGE